LTVLTAVLVAILFLAVGTAATLLLELMRQNGRMLLRLDALERRLDAAGIETESEPEGLPVGSLPRASACLISTVQLSGFRTSAAGVSVGSRERSRAGAGSDCIFGPGRLTASLSFSKGARHTHNDLRQVLFSLAGATVTRPAALGTLRDRGSVAEACWLAARS
jgi:hypothetical protein